MRTAAIGEGTYSYTWRFPICPHGVSIELAVVHALQAESSDGHEPRYGLLLGDIAEGLTRVDGWLQLPSLSKEVVKDAIAKTRRVIGFYSIRDGSAFILSPSEVATAEDNFRPGCVVLLVERRKKGPSEATFYFWRGDAFVHNLPLPFPFHAGLLSGDTRAMAPRPKPALSLSPSRKGKSLAVRMVLLTIAAAIAGGLFASYLNRPRATVVADIGGISETAQWIPTEPRRDLELTWDSQSDSVSNAVSGTLRIEDDGVTRQMTLGRGELLVGSVLYAPAGQRIRVELTTVQRDGRTDHSVVAAQLADLSTPSAPPLTLPKQNPLADAKAKQETQPKNDATQPQAERRPELKRFVWNSAERSAPQQQAQAVDELPQAAAPALGNPNLAAANLPPTVLSAPAPPPPAPVSKAPVPTPVPTKQVSHNGRLIWTGNVPRKGIVELDGRSVSIGTITGGLPGVPINLTITPAEFDDGGLLVFTTDPKRHNHVEAPAASNGWNRITYVWDPERVRQLAILEYPNQSNSYGRLTLRNDARRCSLIFIDWTAR